MQHSSVFMSQITQTAVDYTKNGYEINVILFIHLIRLLLKILIPFSKKYVIPNMSRLTKYVKRFLKNHSIWVSHPPVTVQKLFETQS